ncbi:hypothetical protein VNO78_20649 [Psophocarpus tetragonolobus]|uniref:Uncharacterized protein n=1 Tax=Psophocarpus tetragonolobus TaxID=3891 RepID=A0AAN9SBC1_PSOTE
MRRDFPLQKPQKTSTQVVEASCEPVSDADSKTNVNGRNILSMPMSAKYTQHVSIVGGSSIPPDNVPSLDTRGNSNTVQRNRRVKTTHMESDSGKSFLLSIISSSIIYNFIGTSSKACLYGSPCIQNMTTFWEELSKFLFRNCGLL